MRACDQIVHSINRVVNAHARTVIIALDGASGAGKSTLANLIRPLTSAVVIRLDDFYTTIVPEHQWLERSIPERLQAVFDWERLSRDVLVPLRARQSARWHSLDFASGLTPSGTYGLQSEAIEVSPALVVVLEGTYSSSPPLTDLIDFTVLVQVPTSERRRRTARRDGVAFQEHWLTIWDEVEEYYFSKIRPPSKFDLVIQNIKN